MLYKRDRVAGLSASRPEPSWRLPPGTYRLRQDLNYGSTKGRILDVTLYATLTVVAP